MQDARRKTEYRLIAQAQKGDLEVLAELVSRHENMVWQIALRFREPDHRDFDDLLQVGRMATMRAVRKFNLNSGVYLMTYAYRAVQYAMLRLLTSRDRKLKTCSLDRVLSGTDGLTLATSAPGKEEIEAEVERREWIVMVHAAIGTLSQRDRDIVTRRMYGETLREIGDAWGISKERVRQLEKHALKVVRKQLVGPKMERVML